MSTDSSDLDDNEQSVGLINSRKMEARAEHLKLRNYMSLYSFTTSLGIGSILMTFVWLIKYRGGFGWQSQPQIQFNWHPLLMLFSLIFLYGQTILIYRTGRQLKKKTLKLLHASLNFLAFFLAVIGLKCSYDSHNLANPPIPNLYTMHSWIGLATVIIFTGQFLIGFLSFLYPGLSKTIRQFLLPIHRHIGISTFILALITVASGLTEKTIWTLKDTYSNLPSEGVLINFIYLFTAFYGILVLYLVNENDFIRVNLPEEDEIALAQTN